MRYILALLLALTMAPAWAVSQPMLTVGKGSIKQQKTLSACAEALQISGLRNPKALESPRVVHILQKMIDKADLPEGTRILACQYSSKKLVGIADIQRYEGDTYLLTIDEKVVRSYSDAALYGTFAAALAQVQLGYLDSVSESKEMAQERMLAGDKRALEIVGVESMKAAFTQAKRQIRKRLGNARDVEININNINDRMKALGLDPEQK